MKYDHDLDVLVVLVTYYFLEVDDKKWGWGGGEINQWNKGVALGYSGVSREWEYRNHYDTLWTDINVHVIK